MVPARGDQLEPDKTSNAHTHATSSANPSAGRKQPTPTSTLPPRLSPRRYRLISVETGCGRRPNKKTGGGFVRGWKTGENGPMG